ncbi:tetratricopeptide repeat protein [Vulgatibacter sp.]|uniref:tetratricopeptide repeat protein n=1 Tax=Vulgatibacter sp. TaxID=1971226 RepID=UPI00356AF0A3
MDERERQYRQMIEEFPESPLPWFSLGRYLLEVARFEEAVEALQRCIDADPSYAAALLAQGDALAAIDETERARDAYARCADAALAQGHPTLAGEARERAEEL